MNEALDVILGGLELVFGVRWVVPFLFALPMLVWAGVISVQEIRRTQPYLRAVKVRVRTLRKALGEDTDPSAERAAFSAAFPEVAASLANGRRTDPLILAWAEFHESIVDETATPIENTSRPSTFFMRAIPKQARLVFWSNMMVGLGLLLTFVGLIVALHTARQGMAVGADTSEMQNSLRQLLNVAGAKFFTSVAGVGGSLILRAVERNLSRSTSQVTEELCHLLERGLLYVPPQRLAVKQLRELEAQTVQLKVFNTDFALQVSERMASQFQQVMAPVSASLLTLNENISGMGDSLREGLGQGAADAISQATGGELRALGQTLATLGERLDALSTSVGSSGEHAAEQIRAAGADFSQAASDIRGAFESLAGQVDGLGGKLAAQGEASAKAQSDALEHVLNGLANTQASAAEALGRAVATLERAGAEAANGLQRDVAKALQDSVEASRETFDHALEQSGGALREAALGLAEAVSRAAAEIERAKDGFLKSGEGAERTAVALGEVAGQSRTAAGAIGDATKTFSAAAGPVSQAAQAVNEAAGRLSRSIETVQRTEGEVLQGLKGLVAEVNTMQVATTGAWDDYQTRFQDVDKSLENVTVRLGETLGNTFAEFRNFAQQLDTEFASAVSKLSTSMTQIEEYAEALDAYVDQSVKKSEGAK